MARRIPQSFIDDLLARTDLVALIGERIPLKKSGRNHMACCPFHNEKTPSFSVSEDKQLYHCFGCGESGNAISFLMAYDRLDFVSAIEELAARIGVDVPRDAQDGPDLRPLYALLHTCQKFYREQLQSSEGQAARDYLAQRGIGPQTMERFAIGYAPAGWDRLATKVGIDRETRRQLQLAGMLVVRDGKTYDRFRQRVMFPIRNRRGQLVGFGGRVFNGGEPKYLNSPETPIFHKGREVYGLYEALQANRRLERLIVVEGYMDVVALAESGITNAVATLGTAMSQEHFSLLFRHTNRIVICFDGDSAGQKAAWRALETVLPEIRDGREVRFLTLPAGEDPDSWVRTHGAEQFIDAINKAPVLSEYLVGRLAQLCDLDTVDGRARLAALARPMLEKISDPVYKSLLASQIEEVVGTAIIKRERTTVDRRRGEKSRVRKKPLVMTPLRRVVAFLLVKPTLAAECGDWGWLSELSMPGLEVLHNVVESIQSVKTPNTAVILERFREAPEYQALKRLLGWAEHVPETILDDEFYAALKALKASARTQKLDELMAAAKERSLTPEEKALLKRLLSQPDVHK